MSGERGLRLELPTVEALREAFGQLGVSDKSRIVIYPAADSVQSATRVWFTLDYVGIAERASLLDGGLVLWKAEGRPLSTDVPTPQPAALSVTPKRDAVVDSEWIRTHLTDPDVQIVDARAPGVFIAAQARASLGEPVESLERGTRRSPLCLTNNAS